MDLRCSRCRYLTLLSAMSSASPASAAKVAAKVVAGVAGAAASTLGGLSSNASTAKAPQGPTPSTAKQPGVGAGAGAGSSNTAKRSVVLHADRGHHHLPHHELEEELEVGLVLFLVVVHLGALAFWTWLLLKVSIPGRMDSTCNRPGKQPCCLIARTGCPVCTGYTRDRALHMPWL